MFIEVNNSEKTEARASCAIHLKGITVRRKSSKSAVKLSEVKCSDVK